CIGGSSAGSGTPADRSSANPPAALAIRQNRLGQAAGGGSATNDPPRPPVRTAPTRTSERHASVTVVGPAPSPGATARTAGRRAPAGSSPDLISRLTAAAIPEAERLSTACAIRAASAIRATSGCIPLLPSGDAGTGCLFCNKDDIATVQSKQYRPAHSRIPRS